MINAIETDAGEHGEGSSNAMVRFFQNMTVKVIQDGVGPITGSIPYAEARLSKASPAVAGPIIDPDGAPLRDHASEAAIERVIRTSKPSSRSPRPAGRWQARSTGWVSRSGQR
ncbi:hypothetical protein ACFYUR_02615 [Micromonospora haikouensis]|uniref:hypothetical protein n=1 Tax=Micromonospora haikouensis TaxID=686309 RepID=UPI003675FDCC